MKELAITPECKRHADEAQMEHYAMGNASEEQSARVEEHLLTCEECRRQLASTDAFVRSMRLASAQLRYAPRREWRPWMLPRFAPVLAAVLAVIVLAIGWRVTQNPTAPPAVVALIATRGTATAQVQTGRPLQLQPDLEDLPVLQEYRVEMVDAMGRVVWQSALRKGTSNPITAPAARAGLYFVRLYQPGGSLLREYGLEVIPGR